MPQPSTISDVPSGEAQRIGSQEVTFSVLGLRKMEDIDYKKGMRALRSTDQVGKPYKAAYVPDWGDGSGTVQLKTATDRLTLGETFTFLDTDGTTAIGAIVTQVGVRYQQNDIVKVPINFAEKIN